jgi:hypothetical protein
MHRTLFCTLAMFCIFSSAGVAQASNPLRVQTSATWEYGALTYVDNSGIGVPTAAPNWDSADTSLVRTRLDSIAARPSPRHLLADYRPGQIDAPSKLIQLFNVLGAAGWELVSVPSRATEPYVFKRQLK